MSSLKVSTYCHDAEAKAEAIANEIKSPCVCACAEWTRSVVMKFAVKAQEAHSQFAVPVVSVNSGGVVVRSLYSRGMPHATLPLCKYTIRAILTHCFGQERQYFRTNITCCKCSALEINAQLQAVTLCMQPHIPTQYHPDE